MKSEDPLLVAWAKTLSEKRAKPAVFNRAGEVRRTFGEIDENAQVFADQLDSLEAGGVLGVQIGNHEDWPSVLVACLRRQIVILPLEQSISDQQRDAALKVCGAKAVVPAIHSGNGLEISWREVADASSEWGPDQPVLLKLTSGTTAAPRAVRFRGGQLLADCNQICDTMGISDADLNFGVIPVSHSYGLSNLLTPLIARGVPIALSRDRLPRAVIDDLARTNATVFPGMPIFYQAFCEMEKVPALPSLRLCISAGAPLTGSLAKRFLEKFNQPIHSFYGSSECGGICYDPGGTTFDDGFVGQPMKSVDVEMIDPLANSSQIRVRSAAVGDGYFPEPDEEKLGNGIFVPDDLLARNGNACRIVGRISDVINVAGKKVNPAEVEARLLQFAGVRQAIVFGRESVLRNEEVAACVVGDGSFRENDLLEFCRNALSGWQVPKRVFIVESIPANERGKISRRELARRFAGS